MENIIAQGIYTLIRSSGNESTQVASFQVNLGNRLKAYISVNYENNEIITTIPNIEVPEGFPPLSV